MKASSRLMGIALVLMAAGCQAPDRPLLPLLALPDETPVQHAFLDGPVAADSKHDIVRVQGTKPTDDQGVDIPKSHSAITTCFTHDEIIDLNGVLRLANIDNPTIRLSEAVVSLNRAEQMLARSLLFPNLNAGATLSLHNGPVQNSSGRIFNTDRDSLYIGGGADARVAGTVPIPGIQLIGDLGEAVFAPRMARQRLASSQFDSNATRNNILLDVATSYLALVGAEARLLAYRQSEADYAEVARITANFAAKGQGRESDAQRARSELLLLQSTAQLVEADVVRAATDLSRLLSLDPSIRLRPEVAAPPFIQLVDPETPLETLVETAVAQRPEVAARTIDVNTSQVHLRQEKMRPFLPKIVLGASTGNFGGGADVVGYRFSHFNFRADYDAMAFWTLQNLGVGNRALQNQARSQIGEAEAVRLRVINLVQAEVAEALARTKASRLQMDIARRRVETSQRGFKQDLTRALNKEGRPIEVLNSINLLTFARQDFVASLVEYSQAQFHLYVALGGMPGTSQPEPAHP
ncbi:MAG TPA: TolC family protein [Gemmataceae bacterium]|nr:TolC family protein [Gemmataceae bacterium]